MTLAQAILWRARLGRAGMLLCVLAFLFLADGLVSRFREPLSVFRVLPGSVQEINGPMDSPVQEVGELTYVTTAPHLGLTFLEVHKGYFLGENMWRGELRIGPQTPPGEYALTVQARREKVVRPLPPFRILVYADDDSRQRSYASLVRRFSGHSPWAAAAMCFPAILASFAGVFFLSQKRESLLAQQGRAEIYRVKRGEGEWEISFGLGSDQGLRPDTLLTIWDEQGGAVGTARVQEVSATDALAVTSDPEIRPGYLVDIKK